MISNEKKALLHVGASKLKLTREEYEHILMQHTGKDSCADEDFTDGDFEKVLNHMKALGFWIERKWEQSRPRDPGDLPTPDQLKVIEHLWEDLSEYLAGAKQAAFRRGFYEKRLVIPALGPQTRAQANHAIEVLKNRVYAEMRKSVGMRAKEPA